MYSLLTSIPHVFDKSDLYIFLLACLIILVILKLRGYNISWDHFWQNLDKFLITFMFMFVFVVAVKQSGQIWIQDLVKQLLPAVLALLGARAFQKRADDTTNGNGNSLSQTNSTSTVVTTKSVQTPVELPVTNTSSSVV